jgi:indole-3-glycerol phosphate synthase
LIDFLDVLAQNARTTLKECFPVAPTQIPTPKVSLKKSIFESKNTPLIAEIKAASPSMGFIRKNFNTAEVAELMEKGGATGISVLTEPKYFKGSIHDFINARNATKLPMLMKDIIISPLQLKNAVRIGANVVLLIMTLFNRQYCECGIHDMIQQAQSRNLEVLLETHNEDEFKSAVKTNADLIGINNRDLRTLKVDLRMTKRILERNDPKGKIVVSESGIKTPANIRFLHKSGARAFLIGSAIMTAEDIEGKVKEFVVTY